MKRIPSSLLKVGNISQLLALRHVFRQIPTRAVAFSRAAAAGITLEAAPLKPTPKALFRILIDHVPWLWALALELVVDGHFVLVQICLNIGQGVRGCEKSPIVLGLSV